MNFKESNDRLSPKFLPKGINVIQLQYLNTFPSLLWQKWQMKGQERGANQKNNFSSNSKGKNSERHVQQEDGKEKGWLGGSAQEDLVLQSSTKAHLHWS